MLSLFSSRQSRVSGSDFLKKTPNTIGSRWTLTNGKMKMTAKTRAPLLAAQEVALTLRRFVDSLWSTLVSREHNDTSFFR